MGLVNSLSEIVCSARKDVVSTFRISGQPYAVEWHAEIEPTKEEMKYLLNVAWCSGMSRYYQDRHLPERIEVKWNRNERERPVVSYPLASDYWLEIQQV